MAGKAKKKVADNSLNARMRKRERVGKVLEWLVGCIPYTDIVRLGRKEWGVSETSMDTYIATARRKLPTNYEWGEYKLIQSEAVAKAEKLCAKALAQGDVKTALSALRWAGEVQGLSGTMQAARYNSDLRRQLEETASKRTDKKTGELTLDSFNEVRSLFGKPPMSAEQYEVFRADNTN